MPLNSDSPPRGLLWRNSECSRAGNSPPSFLLLGNCHPLSRSLSLRNGTLRLGRHGTQLWPWVVAGRGPGSATLLHAEGPALLSAHQETTYRHGMLTFRKQPRAAQPPTMPLFGPQIPEPLPGSQGTDSLACTPQATVSSQSVPLC